MIISCMEHTANREKNSFKWPLKEDVLPYLYQDILCGIEAPTPINQRGHYALSKEDLMTVKNMIEH